MTDFKQTSRSRRTSCAQASVLATVPATFTKAQAETILAITKISATDSGFAERFLQACASDFTDAQAQCIHELLQLDADDLRATVADAMEPCDLRRRLRSWCEGETASGLEVDVPSETEGIGLNPTGATPTAR